MIFIKKFTSFLLCFILFISVCGCKEKGKGFTVLTSSGEQLATIKSESDISKHIAHAYLNIVLSEAVSIMCESENLSEEKAKAKLINSGYTVYTAYNEEMNNKLKLAADSYSSQTQIGIVITDLSSNVCAAYASDDSINLAKHKSSPCSAIKPLSVYAPAIDNGTINWASSFMDSPYKNLKDDTGTERAWPKNSTNTYSNTETYIDRAIAESLNTVAVKCLEKFGVNNSLEFLEDNFNFNLEAEKNMMAAGGPDEIIGNLALGSLVEGVTALDMSGYYQIFINGGKYRAPKAVLKIADENAKDIYTFEFAPKQVIKSTTAELMNKMLKTVVSPYGTGYKAKSNLVEVAGKTGTDDKFKNNWFVGLTPEYSCAVWHGQHTENITTEIFAKVINDIYSTKQDYVKDFKYSSGLTQVIYCTETGLSFNGKCPLIETGYFAKNNVPHLCDQH